MCEHRHGDQTGSCPSKQKPFIQKSPLRYTSQVIFAFAHELAILSWVILRDSELLSRERARRSRIIARYISCKLSPGGHRLYQDNDPKHTSRYYWAGLTPDMCRRYVDHI